MRLSLAAAVPSFLVAALAASLTSASSVDVAATAAASVPASGAETSLKIDPLALDKSTYDDEVAEHESEAAAAATADGQKRRRLYDGPTASVRTEFKELTCNAFDSAASCQNGGAVAFDQAFVDGFNAAGNPVLLSCNTCYEAVNNSDIIITYGLNIEGRLTIPTNAKVNITTPHIFVQGELVARDDQVVSEENTSLRVTMTGSSDQMFIPHESQAALCPQGGCNVGPKAIVVAGGRLNIDGYAANGGQCPSWLHLIDIDSPPPDMSTLALPDSFYLKPKDPSEIPELHRRRLEEMEVDAAGVQRRLEHCPATLIDEKFNVEDCVAPSCQLNTRLEDGFRGWKGGWGAVAMITQDGTFRVTNRTIGSGQMIQGPEYDLGKFKGCLMEGQKYLFSAKVRLSRTDGTSSICGARNATLNPEWYHCPQ